MDERRIHQLFVVSILLKGVHALIEVAGGVALYVFSTDAIIRWLYAAGGDSNDLIARFARTFTGQEHHFYAFYLVNHGLVNMISAGALLSRRLWAYPATFAVLACFIAYQLYRFTYTQDIGLLALTALDLVVMGLAWHEYRVFKHHLSSR
jgi:uncharacterized membrane protein